MPAMTYLAFSSSINATPMTTGQTLFVITFAIVALVVIGAIVYDFHKNSKKD